MIIRSGEPGDLAAIANIQAASPDASQWDVTEYLHYDLAVAQCGLEIAGFSVSRPLGAGECELLNLAIAPAFRRRGIGRRLVETLLSGGLATVWLEVRESNVAARNFYKVMGFTEVGQRPEYYRLPPEAAVVMKFHSC